ncbi:MAG: hypothetical protein M1836_001093 [Candelina mexicana]|nr:MAG: hypothetical protein M1836_001093 [Candelina mexicana]
MIRQVTGGAQGLGLVCARALLEHGVSYLAIFDLDEELGAKAKKHLAEHALRGSGGMVVFHKVDVTDEKAVDKAVVACAVEFDGIDILLCFAGITDCQAAVDYKIEDWRRVMDVNLSGSFLVARAVARNMILNNVHGSILFTASMSGYIVNYPQPHSAYAVSKAGVHHLTRSMAAEWAGHRIRVNSISPGIMNTRLTAGDAQAKLRQMWMERSPMGRMGDPEDLTGAVVLLCSEAGRFMTGTDIRIDGEFCLCRDCKRFRLT